jgi:hypothetical protein
MSVRIIKPQQIDFKLRLLAESWYLLISTIDFVVKKLEVR